MDISFTAVEHQEAMLDAEVYTYRQATYADSTKKTYRSHLRVYLRFCLYFGYTILPASTKTLVRYIIFLARNHVPSSVRQYLNVIRLLHIEQGLPNPLEDNFPVRSVLKGVDRLRGSPPKRKLPITPELLIAFHGMLDMANDFDFVFFCACLIAFFTFFRKSTLLSQSLKVHDKNRNLCRSDARICAEGAVIKVKHSKTIQLHERELSVPLAPAGGILCPVKAVVRLLVRYRSLPGDAPLFSYISRGKHQCLSHIEFVKKLKSLVSRCGLNEKDYSGHSFRRAGCTFAWQNGVSAQHIMAQGDWKSDCWLKYVDISMSDRWTAAQTIASSVSRLSSDSHSSSMR